MQAALTFDIKPNQKPLAEADRLKAFESLGFGTLFSDHMAVIRWSSGSLRQARLGEKSTVARSRSMKPAAATPTPTTS